MKPDLVAYRIPAEATIHSDVGKVVFADREGGLELRMTEEQMLKLIEEMIGYAIRVRPADPNLDWLRIQLDRIYQQMR